MAFIRRLFSWVRNRWVRRGSIDQPAIKRRRRRKTYPYKEDEQHPDEGHEWLYADWNIRKLLESLDRTFELLEQADMRCWNQASPDMRKAFRKLGPLVLGKSWMATGGISTFKEVFGLPAFAAAIFPDAENTKDYFNIFGVFCMKKDRFPHYVAPIPGTPYEFGQIFNVDGKLYWETMHGAVDKDGKVKLCRHLVYRHHKFRDKRGKWVEYTQKIWEYPKNDEPTSSGKQRLPLEGLLAITLSTWIAREFHWNVIARKGKNRATFPITQNDAPRFFRDREKIMARSGLRQKPIFHAVRPHERKTKTKTTIVHHHYRGLRKFKWGKASVTILDPRNPSLTGFTAPSQEFDDEQPVPDRMLTVEKAADVLGAIMERN